MRLAAAALLLACACTTEDPGLTAFRREALPVLEARCTSSGCHGVTGEPGEVIDRDFFFVDVDAGGAALDVEAAYRTVLGRVNSREPAELSTLLRKPLDPAFGGLSHAGGADFDSRAHPDYQRLLRWARGERGGREGLDPALLSPLERHFAREVYPGLVARGCTAAPCHGDRAFGGLFLESPAIDTPPFVPAASMRLAYEEGRRNLALQAPERSRLVTKMLPLVAGGVPHKGGNDVFTASARERGRPALEQPEVQAILEWARREQAAALGEAPQVTAVAFVRGPAAPAAPFDAGAFVPGSDVWLLSPPEPGGAQVNLTAAAHPGEPADVRDPAVSHDGTRIAFAMRRAGDPGFSLWEIGLDGSGLARLTEGPGDDRWPVYGPRGSVVFASTRDGLASDRAGIPNWEIHARMPDGTLVRHTYTPSPEVRPAMYASGEFAGTVGFTVLRAAVGGVFRAVLFRFPLDRDRAHHLQPEYHVHHGLTAPADVLLGSAQLADGRFVTTLLDASNVWESGQLAVVERQFGPDLPAGREALASVSGFRHAISVLTDDAASGGASAAAWRDPAALPDGRILAARATGPLDLDDPLSAPPDTGIVRAAIAGDPPRLEGVEVLADEPGVAEWSPVAVVARAEEDGPHPDFWDPSRDTGLFVHSGVLDNEALLARLAPEGPREHRRDIRALRFVSAVDRPAGSPAASAFDTVPSYVLSEAPVEEDGSALVELPARRPFRVVALDGDGLQVGAAHPQWFSLMPGERFPQGVPATSFALRCAGCHGVTGGDPDATFAPRPDIVSAASVTLASHELANPRRPRPPFRGAQRTADFRTEVGPLLERACAGCHGDASPAAGLTLSGAPGARFTVGYEALAARTLVSPAGARGSRLAEVLLGRDLDAAGSPAPSCPAPERLSPGERSLVLLWLDLGATFEGLPGG